MKDLRGSVSGCPSGLSMTTWQVECAVHRHTDDSEACGQSRSRLGLWRAPELIVVEANAHKREGDRNDGKQGIQ